jgi:hypothetical protein
MRQLPLCLSLILTAACSPPPEPKGDDTERTAADLVTARATAYRDVEETFTNEIDQSRWFDLKRGLQHDFDDICGDTFCEGDFSNLASLSFRCSLSVRTGQLKSCLWLFAGSYETVTPSTGSVRPVAKFFPCAIPLHGTPAAVMDALLAPGGRGPLWNTIPGGAQSIYDALGECL